MLTYQVRPRILKFEPESIVTVPGLAEVTFEFAPAQAFGVKGGGGRTVVKAVEMILDFNVCTGQFMAESKTPLSPLSLKVDHNDTHLLVIGNDLIVTKIVGSHAELSKLIEAIYYLLPLLLATEFVDPPVIESVKGVVSGKPFIWKLEEWRIELLTTTQDKQTKSVKNAWYRFHLLLKSDNRRVVAALHYFHKAVRLSRVSSSPGEFIAESLLNYCKVLEVLFSTSRDIVREQLQLYEYSTEEIDRDFIPVMLLRSKIDVAHISLVIFAPEQLATLHRYADRAENVFRSLLSRVLARIDDGSLKLPNYSLHAADPEVAKIIERLANALNGLSDKP
jgi:hypothetical protein